MDASSECVYPSTRTENQSRRRKRPNQSPSLDETPAVKKVSNNYERSFGKIQDSSKPDSPPEMAIDQSGYDGMAGDAGPLTEDSLDYFALPNDFLHGIFPDDGLQDSGNFLADLNLDYYFPSDPSFSDLNPGSQGAGRFSHIHKPTEQY